MSVNDNSYTDDGIRKAQKLHGFVVFGVIFLVVFACVSVWVGVRRDLFFIADDPPMNGFVVPSVGQAKPLPDYMIEKIKPDELEYLKP